jgi:hypothetical protein
MLKKSLIFAAWVSLGRYTFQLFEGIERRTEMHWILTIFGWVVLGGLTLSLFDGGN